MAVVLYECLWRVLCACPCPCFQVAERINLFKVCYSANKENRCQQNQVHFLVQKSGSFSTKKSLLFYRSGVNMFCLELLLDAKYCNAFNNHLIILQL
jgi:hypothetical protein